MQKTGKALDTGLGLLHVGTGHPLEGLCKPGQESELSGLLCAKELD